MTTHDADQMACFSSHYKQCQLTDVALKLYMKLCLDPDSAP